MSQFCQYGLLIAAGCILYVEGMEIEDDYRPHPSCTNKVIYGSPLIRTDCRGDSREPLILPENFNTSRFQPQLSSLYLQNGVVTNPFLLIPTIFSKFSRLDVYDFNLHATAPRFPLDQLLVNQKSNLDTLVLYRVKLVEITASDFLGFHRLQYLSLNNVHITTISISVFEYLGNVNSLPPAPADKPASLDAVIITSHRLSVVDWSFLKPIANSVKWINLSYNRITAINSSSHFTLANAETVALYNNEPPTIPAAVFNTFDTNCKTLNLWFQYTKEHLFCPLSQDCSCCELQPFMQRTRDHNMTSVVKTIRCGIEGLDGLTAFSTGPIASKHSCSESRQTTTTVAEQPSTTAPPSTITTTTQITPITHAETSTVASRYDVCQTGGITVTCTKGKVAFSDPHFNTTDELRATLNVDNTLRCRTIMYNAQSWLLAKQVNLQRHYVEPIAVSCRRGLVWVSDTKPDESEATTLTFETTGNLQCREFFLGFLKHVSSL